MNQSGKSHLRLKVQASDGQQPAGFPLSVHQQFLNYSPSEPTQLWLVLRAGGVKRCPAGVGSAGTHTQKQQGEGLAWSSSSSEAEGSTQHPSEGPTLAPRSS